MIGNKIEQIKNIPKHIALIMDGNGRWAKKRLMPRSLGHKAGMERMVGLIEHAFDLGVDYVTVYALSTENLKRPKEELAGLYQLIRNHFATYMEKICRRGVRLNVIGDITLLPKDVQQILNDCMAKTLQYNGKAINVALCYGARAELVRAVNIAVQQGKMQTEESLSNLLYTANQPDVDLLIRTGNEVRLSNFLLYQSAYAELYFSEKMFPDFSNHDLDKAVEWFSNRVRRFGKTDEQLKDET